VKTDGMTITDVSSLLKTDDAHILVVADMSRDPMPPNAYAIGIAFTTTLVVAAVLGEASRWGSGGYGLAVMAAAVGVAAWWCRPWVGLCAGALGWLMFNGFVVDQFGALAWHGRSDAVRLGTLLAIAVAVSLVRAVTVALTRRIVLEEISPRTPAPQIPQRSGGSHA
jgi:hypothetical protein